MAAQSLPDCMPGEARLGFLSLLALSLHLWLFLLPCLLHGSFPCAPAHEVWEYGAATWVAATGSMAAMMPPLHKMIHDATK